MRTTSSGEHTDAAGLPVERGVGQREAPWQLPPRQTRRPAALVGALVGAVLMVALVGVYAFLLHGHQSAVTPVQQATTVSQVCGGAPVPHSVYNIGGAIGARPFWVGGFTGNAATLDVSQSAVWPQGRPAKVVTQLDPTANQPVTLTGKNLADGAPLRFQFGATGVDAPSTTSVVFDPARGQTDAGYILLSATGCYSLTARWSTGSWTVDFQGLV